MKKNLGKLSLLLLLQIVLNANQLATYKLQTNKTEAYVKEPIIITFDVKQTKHTDTMFFLLQAHTSPDYEIKLLHKSNANTKEHYAQASFTYMLFPLKEKELILNFDFTVETVSSQALAQSYIDDHDGGKAIASLNQKIPLKPLHIHVKKLPKDIELFGDFNISVSSNTSKITSYDDANIIFTLQGKGYKNSKKSLYTSIANVTLFSDIDDKSIKLTKEGYITTRVYTYAMSAKKSFTTPKLTLKAFSYTNYKPYTLQVPSYSIEVTKIDPLSLLDKSESPQSKALFDLEKLQQFFIYILLFGAGYISAKLSNIEFIKKSKSVKYKDITEAKTAKALIILLLNKYQNYDINPFIKELELLEYKESTKNLSTIQHEIVEFCKNS